MPLPILQHRSSASPDLVRLYLQTDQRMAEHLADPQPLDIGTAFAHSAPHQAADHIRDVALPAGMPPQQAIDIVNAHFAAAGGTCHRWIFNSSAPTQAARTLESFLTDHGHRPDRTTVWSFPQIPDASPQRADLQVIPSRASYRHVRELFTSVENELDMPGLPDRIESHLDDGHLDALLALKDGRPVGHAAILSTGEIGRLDLLYVHPDFRRQGVARTLLAHILDICRRSLLRHVLAGTAENRKDLAALYGRLGMEPVGVVMEMTR